MAALAFTLPATLAAEIAVSIAQPSFAFNAATLPSSTHATLHAAGAPLTAVLNRANKFVFANVPSGSYLFEVHARDYVFEPLRIDVADEAGKEYVKSWQSFRGNEWDNKGEKRGEGEANVAGGVAKADVYVSVLGSKEYYAKRQGFSVMSIFGNPMILIALFSLVLVVGMPYLMENMDPETKAEFEAMQKERGLGSNPMAAAQGFDLAGWMAGSSSDQPAVEEKPSNEGPQKRKKR